MSEISKLQSRLTSNRHVVAAFAALTIVCSVCLQAADPAVSYRQPVALALTSDDHWLLTANRKSGTVSLINLRKQEAQDEYLVGQTLSDLSLSENERALLITDEGTHELLLAALEFSAAGLKFEVRQRLAVSPYPVSVVASLDGRRAYVASLWSRRITVVELAADEPRARIAGIIDLSFAPRKQLLLPGGSQLLVADAFGGRIAIIDTEQMAVECVRSIPAHNIRGLALSPDASMLLLAHQMLNDFAHADRNDVHWGLMMSNDLRWVRLDRFLAGETNLFEGGHMHPLGHAGSATGDPAGLAVGRDGTVVVALGGVNEVATGKESNFSLERIRVSRRPTAVVVTREGHRALVANTWDDSISCVDLPKYEVAAEIRLGSAPDLSTVDRGEQLFYDAKLSHDGWMSCHSCHTDGHTNGQLNDNLSDGSFGAAKRVLSLLGCADTAPYAWNGSAPSLAQQIHNSLTRTMQNDDGPTPRQADDLTAFLRSLKSPPSIDRLRGVADEVGIARGQKLFSELRCSDCHVPPFYTSPDRFDVGLKDKLGNDHFNPPSLLGVGHREPYFHDNRAATLRDVLEKHRHQLTREISPTEVDDLLKFLRSL